MRPKRPCRGERHPRAVLDAAKVRTIRERYRAGESIGTIAAGYGIAAPTVYKILNGQAWAHVPDPLGPVVFREPWGARRRPGVLGWAKAAAIRAEAEGLPRRRRCSILAAKYGVSVKAVWKLLNGATWPESQRPPATGQGGVP